MPLGDSIKTFLKKQFIDVIHWTEPEDGILAARFPMQDMEIQNGAQLTVRESQFAMFVNEGRCADVFAPGLYTLNTHTLPVLTNLMNWDKMFQSPFKSDVYFFSSRQQVAQRWGTAQPVTIRDRDFGAIRIRGFGVYSWHITDPKAFHTKISGTRETYHVADLEPQLRQTIISHISDAFAQSGLPFLDMAANYLEVGERIKQSLTPAFSEMGIVLDTLVVENLSLPDELQKRLDERIGMNMIGNMQQYTQYQAAQSLPIAAANEGGGSMAGLGVGVGAGLGLGQMMAQALNPQAAAAAPPPQQPPPMGGVAPVPVPQAPQAPPAPAAAAPDSKFCLECGRRIPRASKFCPDCGKPQA
jgi:membrane protease subunit (stomatin/prohibitin family)